MCFHVPTFRLSVQFACAALVALAALTAAPGARAQQPSPAMLAVAGEILELKGSMTMFEPLVPGVVEQAKSVFLQTNPMLSKPLDEVATNLRKELAPRSLVLKTEIAKIYASRYTEQELKDTLAFYKSPLGKKILEQEPQFVERTLQHAQDWANRLSEEVLNKYRAEMKKKGHNL
jgi:hypothetical protein